MSAYWPFFALLALVVVIHLVERARPGLVVMVEERILTLILAGMVLISFAQVVARYAFNSGWTGALDLTRVMFAWLILFGMSYGLKTGLHLGVDVVIRLLPRRLFRICAILGALAVFFYAVILLSADWLSIFGGQARGGAVFYWQRFFNSGLGMEMLRWPEWMSQMFALDERVPRWLAYLILPVGLALLAYRALEASWQIATNQREAIIAGHEAEQLVADNRNSVSAED
ncbi:TRAP transporter small permease [Salipiger mangrovisoli]|uniref:TRAP transporter small permease protein n=1 Tax=Salipiger mangrovisoli TaxID=2865933 RepID=A0ABR9X1C8_9RHOB|nr:TRAP transporter small permease [Salipiger mangrovisoli]MBE9637241.1 TRAP transporter small permease [Salipiger mangrovisoli]